MKSCFLGLVVCVAMVLPSVGAAAGSAAFVAPIDGSTQAWGIGLNTEITWTDIDPSHTYVVTSSPLSTGGPCIWNPGTISSGDTSTCTINLSEVGTYTIHANDSTDATALGQVSFTVTCQGDYFPAPEGSTGLPCVPRLLYVSESASPLKFYPLVHDGYRDTTRFSFRFNRVAHVRVEVRSGEGRIIRNVGLGILATGSWSWNGRNNGGSKVATGHYRIRAVSTDGPLTAHTGNVRVEVATGWITKHATRARLGNQVSSQSTSGSCFITRDSYFKTATLDCWGGNYARVTYAFSVPATTFRVSGGVSGKLAFDDICCDGSVTKGVDRLSRRRVVAWAQVTGWRAYDVERARVTYYYKKRI
jgi:hypothetical protein